MIGVRQTLLATALVLAVTASAQSQPMPTIVYPGALSHGSQAKAQRGPGGRFVFDTTVNGVALPMLFDTGSTSIALCAADAAKVGINVDSLTYSATVHTANGTAQVAPMTIETLTIGSITRHNVPAIVAKSGLLNTSLLGQSFITRLAGYRLDGDQLVLQGSQ